MKYFLLCLFSFSSFVAISQEEDLTAKSMNLKGKVKKITEKHYESSKKGKIEGEMVNENRYEFNELGQLISKYDWKPAFGDVKNTYEYSADGKMSMKTTASSAEDHTQRYEYTKNGKTGYWVKGYYKTPGEVSCWDTYTFNSNGQIAELAYSINDARKFRYKFAYTYNANGLVTEKKADFGSGYGIKYTFEYDKANNIIAENEYNPYDSKRNVFNDYSYKFDKQNNWIQNIHKEEGISTYYYLVERTVEYY